MEPTPAHLAATADISYDPTGPRNGKWYVRRADGILNSYETLLELAAFAGNPQLLWQRYDALMRLYREWKPAEAAEITALREWLVLAGIVIESEIF